MNFFWLLPPAIIAGLAVGQYLLVRRLLAHWTMTRRREYILAQYLFSMRDMFVAEQGSTEEVIDLFNVYSIRLADECFNQSRYTDKLSSRVWPKVPEVGESWPDFQPAIVDFDD